MVLSTLIEQQVECGWLAACTEQPVKLQVPAYNHSLCDTKTGVS